jgi:hypothetical protein
MLEVEIAVELSKLEVAMQLSEKWNELLPPVLVASSQEEDIPLGTDVSSSCFDLHLVDMSTNGKSQLAFVPETLTCSTRYNH